MIIIIITTTQNKLPYCLILNLHNPNKRKQGQHFSKLDVHFKLAKSDPAISGINKFVRWSVRQVLPSNLVPTHLTDN